MHGDLKGTNMLLGFGKNGAQQVYLVDFGLASHYTTKDFKPDPKKMHNGTIEYTSRDAHQVKNPLKAMHFEDCFIIINLDIRQGVPTMRGDLEILAYNLIQWSGGELPWERSKLLATPIKVQQSKEDLLSNLDSRLEDCFPNQKCPGKNNRL